MHPVRAVCIFFIFVFLGAALVSPWLYQMTVWASEAIPALEPLAKTPFHRYVNRALLGLGLIGLWPLLRNIGIQSWADVGLEMSHARGRLLGQGFLLGFASLACVVILAIGCNARAPLDNFSWPKVSMSFAQAGLTAILVAILEELLFRGALFGALRKAWPWLVALVASSGIYALLHFFEKPISISPIHWASGFQVLAEMMKGFGIMGKLVPGFFNLTLAGFILGLAFQRFGSLYFSIGLHGGWIFWLKSSGFLTKPLEGASLGFWGTEKLIDGWLVLIVLGLVLVLVSMIKPQRAHALPRSAQERSSAD
jgi:membrane protease YdiL (CAAX protease family)